MSTTLCLGIETSCDDSSLAVVNQHYDVVALLTQNHLACLQPYQGIMPEVASREHVKALPLLLKELRKSVDLDAITFLAYTAGPGLAGSLLVGASMALSLSLALKKPLLPIHHLEGHHQAYLIEHKTELLPALSIIVSGGHTQLMLITKPFNYSIIGQTRDDAAGEAFDKIAKHIGFDYPGGPKLAQTAQQGRPHPRLLSIPLASQDTLDFSFSGLKTQAMRLWDAHTLSLPDYCATVEDTIAQTIAKKVKQALTQYPVRSLILSGGVACNQHLRSVLTTLAQERSLPLFIPAPRYCADNAAMIAAAGMRRWQDGQHPTQTISDPIIRPRWSIEELNTQGSL